MSDSITSLIGLKDSEVDFCRDVVTSENGNVVHTISVQLANHGGRCLSCGTFTKKVKEYKTRIINHSVFIKGRCIIRYRARRFRCPSCGATFFEDNPFEQDYKKISSSTVSNVLKLLKEYNQTFSSVARTTNLSVSEVIKIFDEHVQPERKQLSSCVGMDEFYFSRHATNKYALFILSLDKGYVIDMRENRIKHSLISYFRSIPKEERNLVRYFSIDMNDNYREAVNICFPGAKLCADPFHVIKNLNDSLNKVRLRVLRQYADDKHSDEYYLLKYRDNLLYKDVDFNSWNEVKKNHHFKYTLSEMQMRDMLLDISPQLKRAWELKEKYMLFDGDDRITIEERGAHLDSLIDEFISSDIAEMISMGLTFNNWRTEIINSFSTYTKKINVHGKMVSTVVRVTSGPVEGKNKYIKILLNLANGYTNFPRFKNRAMYVLNRLEKYSDVRLENTVRKAKKQ